MGKFGRWAAVGVLAVGATFGGARSRPDGGVSRAESEPVRHQAAVTLAWANPAEARVNRPAAYTLTVTNTGSQPVQRVVVQVRVPAGVTASDTDPAARAVGGVLMWDLGTLAPAEARPLAMSLASPTRGRLTAEAWVTLTGTAATTVPVREPKLEATIDAPATVEIGEPFTVSYGAKNAGDRDFGLLRFEAAKPKTLGSSEDHTGNIPELLVGEVWDGGSGQTALAPGVYTYTFAVTAADGLTATAAATVRVLAPKLAVGVTGPAELGLTKYGVYTVRVTNTGDLTAANVRLTADFAAGVKAALRDTGSFMLTGGIDSNAPEFQRPDVFALRPGESAEFTYEGQAVAPGGHVHKVAVTDKRGITAAAECRTVVKGVPGIRMEVIDTADPVKVGDETTYEIKVTNTGTETDRNLVLACDLPAGLVLVKAAGPVPYLERAGVDFDRPGADKNVRTVTFDPVRDLGPKTEVVFQVTVKAEKAGTARFKAAITSDHLTTPVTKEESTTVYGE